MAGIYNGHLLEFPQIRVDCFTSPPRSPSAQWQLPQPTDPHLPLRPAPPAQLFLLTHVHSDHLLGLYDDFTGHIVCSPDTKRMLLRLEAEKERDHVHTGVRERVKRKYEGLKRKIVGQGTKDEHIVDRIEAIPYGLPRVFDLGYEAGKPVRVTITLLDANHCPGSTMFLVTSPQYSVLHTGDIRADDLFLKSLRRNTILSEFLVPWFPSPSIVTGGGRRTLDRIYLDTGAVLGTSDMPDREGVLRDLFDQMNLFPEDTIFFLNVWCFGWEDVIKEVARNFGTVVHVDRYKRSIYDAIHTDPFLSSCTTSDPYATRFHACERRAKCEACRTFNKSGQREWNKGKRVVNVNMVEIKSAGWDMERQSLLEQLGRAATDGISWPTHLDCPIARHSPLPELQALVRMFQPSSISPNSMVQPLNGLDYYLLPDLFRDCISEQAYETLITERDIWFETSPQFGVTYLENIKKLKKVRNTLAPPNDAFASVAEAAFDKQECLPDQRTLGRGRCHHAIEQASRAGGLPKISTDEISTMLRVMAEGGDLHDSSRFPGSVAEKAMQKLLVQEAGGTGLQGYVGWRYRPAEEDYDTEDDEHRLRRKKRRSAQIVRPPASFSVKSESPVKQEMVEDRNEYPHPPRVSAIASLPPHPSLSSHFSPIRLKDASPSVLFESRSVTSARGSKSRYSVDKSHLRALAQVCADVDDL